MNQQQNKHSSKNYKRNSTPAKLISSEYALLNKNGQIKANFKTKEEVVKYIEQQKEEITIYNIKVYKINNKSLTIKNKEN